MVKARQKALAWLQAENYYLRGKQHESNQRFKKAARAFRMAIKLDPMHRNAYLDIHSICCRKGKKRKAARYLKAAELNNPDPATTYYQRGLLFLSLGWQPEAQRMLEKALTLRNDFPECEHELAIILTESDLSTAYKYWLSLAHAGNGYSREASEAIRSISSTLLVCPAANSHCFDRVRRMHR